MTEYEHPVSLRPEALIILQEDDYLRRLCLTWPKLPHGSLPGPSGYELIHEWSRISGVDSMIIEAKAPLLFANGIISLDGTAAKEALDYIAFRVLREVRT